MKIPDCFGCFGETDDCFGCPLADECEDYEGECEEENVDDVDEFLRRMREGLRFIRVLRRFGLNDDANKHISTSLKMFDEKIEKEKRRLRILKLLKTRFKKEMVVEE
jgi:hypothetical protein